MARQERNVYFYFRGSITVRYNRNQNIRQQAYPVTCGSGKHHMIVGLDGLDDRMNSENYVIDNNRSRGCPKNTYCIKNCAINFYAHLMIQILGLGRTGMETILGMLSIILHQGSKPAWSLVQNAVGSMQQLLADMVQKENLQVEIERMKQAGIMQVEYNGKLLWPFPVHLIWHGREELLGNVTTVHWDMLSLLVASQTKSSNKRFIQRVAPPASCD